MYIYLIISVINPFVDEPGYNINNLDAWMTPSGIKQAQLTAEWMKDEIESRGFKKIKMISSPMIRAIQTAAIIADKISIDEIDVNNGYVEHLDPGCAK